MLKNSLFFKLLAAVLCACLALTVIAVIAKNSSGSGDSKVNTPTDTTPADTTSARTTDAGETTSGSEETSETPVTSDEPIIIDETKTLVASQGMNSFFAWVSQEDSSKVLVTVVSDLKPGAKYRLAFSVAEDSLPNGCELGRKQKYLLALSGNDSVGNALNQTKTQFGSSNDVLLAEGTIDFTVNDDFYYVSDSSGKAAMVFVFVSFTAASDEEANMLSKQIGDCIVFSLYEITQSGT